MKIILDACIDNLPEGVQPIQNYRNYLINILVNIGYNPETAPVGDLLRRLHGLDGEWVVVSPINWQATHNDSMLVAEGHDFSLTEERSHFLFNKFAEFVADEGMQLHMHDAVTWLLKVNNKPRINARPVKSVLHRSLMQELANLDGSLYWQKFITMSQMLFTGMHLSYDNNSYPINGVWVWGAGDFLDKSHSKLISLDDKASKIVKILSVDGCDYTSNTKVTKDTIFLGSSIESLKILPEKTFQKINCWYWNNNAYKLQSKWNLYKVIKCKFNRKN